MNCLVLVFSALTLVSLYCESSGQQFELNPYSVTETDCFQSLTIAVVYNTTQTESLQYTTIPGSATGSYV